MEKLKIFLLEEDNKQQHRVEKKSDHELKMEISSLISLDIVRQGRPFSDGTFVKQMLNKILKKLNYDQKILKHIPCSRSSVVRRTGHIGHSVELAIWKKLSECEFFSFCLDESTDFKLVNFFFQCFFSVAH